MRTQYDKILHRLSRLPVAMFDVSSEMSREPIKFRVGTMQETLTHCYFSRASDYFMWKKILDL